MIPLLFWQMIDLLTNERLIAQINPVWSGPCGIKNNEFELVFPVTLQPLELHNYRIVPTEQSIEPVKVLLVNCPVQKRYKKYLLYTYF